MLVKGTRPGDGTTTCLKDSPYVYGRDPSFGGDIMMIKIQVDAHYHLSVSAVSLLSRWVRERRQREASVDLSPTGGIVSDFGHMKLWLTSNYGFASISHI